MEGNEALDALIGVIALLAVFVSSIFSYVAWAKAVEPGGKPNYRRYTKILFSWPYVIGVVLFVVSTAVLAIGRFKGHYLP